MKILLLDWEHIGNACRHYFYKELSRRADVVRYPFPGMGRSLFSLDIPYRYNRRAAYYFSLLSRFLALPKYLEGLKEIVNKENPDVLYCNKRLAKFVNYTKIKEVEAIPKIIRLGDPPRREYSKMMNFLKTNSINNICMGNPQWRSYLPADTNTKLTPWSVDIEIFRDYDQPLMYDVVASGVLSRHYPVRYEIKKMMDNSENMKYLDYVNFAPFIGRKIDMEEYFPQYARFLSSSKIFIFYNGLPSWTVAKYVEGLASSSLMMAPMPMGGETLHLEPGRNFVEIDEKNFVEKISYYLENKDERIKIAKRGTETARKYLDVKDLVTGFIKEFESVI